MNSFYRSASLVFCCFLSFTSCTKNKNTVSQGPVITVNDSSLSAQEFSKRLSRKLKSYDAMAAKDPINLKRVKEGLIRDFVVSQLLEQFAQANGVTVSEEEITAEISRIRNTYPDDMTFKTSLISEGLDFKDWSTSIGRSLLEKKAFQSIFPKDTPAVQKELMMAAQKYYDSHPQEFTKPDMVKVQQILVLKPDDAERLLKKIKGGASFSDLAKKYSISPDSVDNGVVGYVTLGTVPAFDVAFKLRSGQYTSVVKSSYGFHILKVLDRKKARRLSFSESKEKVLRKITSEREQQAYSQWLEAHIKQAKIKKDDALIEKLQVHTDGSH